MARKKTTQKGTDLNENFHLKDKIALALSAMAVLLAGFPGYFAVKNEKQKIKVAIEMFGRETIADLEFHQVKEDDSY